MKKVLSILLSMAVLASLCSFSVFAKEYENSLILYYSFDNGGTATVGKDAESYNVSFSAENSVMGKACFMDGNSSYLKLPNELNKSLGGNFTISTWAKFESLSWWMRVFDFGSGNDSYAFLGLSAPNDLRYALLNHSTGSELNMTAAGAIRENEWTHLTLVRENKVMKLYVNGILLSESSVFGNNSPSDIENAANYIGKSQFSADPYFNGYIDEFKVFDKALDTDEIIENMSTGIKTEYAQYVAATSQLYDGREVKENIYLPTFENEETSIKWSSDNEAITPEGIVTRSLEDLNVTLTATVTTNGEVNEFPYTVFVPGATNVNAKITVDATKKGVDINPDMIGLFFEDINYAADGGLYAECVQNRSFEAVNAQWDANPKPIPDYAWSFSSLPTFSNENPLNENNRTFLRFINPAKLTAFSNVCYEGFPVEAGEKFDFSVFLRANGEYTGQIMVTLLDDSHIVGRTFIDTLSPEWTKYEREITAVSSATNAKLQITILNPMDGSLDFDMVSLFPQNTWMNRKNGLRSDLVQMLKDLHPGFLRFPGGCIIEGYNLSNRYSWKDTVGPVEERKENWNRWQLHTGGDGRYAYCQSYGLGFYEYFLLCEDIGAFPLPVVNVGIGCQYQTGDVSSMEDLYSIYIQDALDLIEFANGDTDTTWGALRAQMGHSEPFNLEYIGIGNEQWETDRVNFFERYEAFEEEIHKVYPHIKLIATSGPDASGDRFDKAWSFLKSHSDKGEESFAYAVDEHYYRTPDWFYTNLDRYDGYDRNGYKAFPGEYASRYSQSKTESNMNSALSIAAFMTSLEKNADVVALASYAPLFAREGYTQWYPDLIGFNNSAVFGAPDYYVQSMYSNNKGTYTVENKTKNLTNDFTPHGRVGISTWTTAASFYDMKLTDNVTGEEIELGEPVSTGSGSWYKTESGYTQEDNAAQAPALLFGTEEMENYTFTLKAKKHSGTEGFLIPVMWENEQNYFTCNIGGWGNAYSAIQRTENGNTYEYSVQNTTKHIETDREYEIKITVEPHKLTCYLDGEVVNFASFRQNVYSTSSFDEETGDIIIKAVNTRSVPMETLFSINADYICPVAHVTELSSKDGYSINSIESPKNVAPVEFEAEVSESFNYFLPANSFTVFRIHTRDDVIVESEAVEIALKKGEELVLPEDVEVTLLSGEKATATVTWDIIPKEFTLSSGTKVVEGKIENASVYAYATVNIEETGEAVVISPQITRDNENVNFSIAFSDGENNNNVIAVVAAYDEEGTMTLVKTKPVTQSALSCSISLSDFAAEYSVKAFMLNGANYITDAVIIK